MEKEIMITHIIRVDECIAKEILDLNNDHGILTIDSCCGHNETNGYISVKKNHKKNMEELNYKYNIVIPYLAKNGETRNLGTFVPKSKCLCEVTE